MSWCQVIILINFFQHDCDMSTEYSTIFTERMQPFDSHVLFWGKRINSFLNNPINRCNWTNKYLGQFIIDIMILTTAIRSLACFSCELCRKYLARSIINIHNFQCFRLLFDKRIANKNSSDPRPSSLKIYYVLR